MANIDRSGGNELILRDEVLRKKWVQIQINEKTSKIDGLNLRLQYLDSVEKMQIDLEKNKLRKEIEQLSEDLETGIIDI